MVESISGTLRMDKKCASSMATTKVQCSASCSTQSTWWWHRPVLQCPSGCQILTTRWIERSSGANDSQGVKLQMSSWLWSWLRWLAVLWWLWFSIGKSRLPILNETLLAKQGGFRKTIRKFCDFKQHGWTFVNNVRAISHHQSFKIPIRKTTNLKSTLVWEILV